MKHLGSKILKGTVILASCLTFGVLLFLIAYILIKGLPNLSPKLFSLHYTTENVSMLPAIVNTIEMTLCSLIVAVPLGICTAIYLVEYAKKGNKVVGIIRLTAETLSGIPSIVYGLFGMLFFVTYLKWGVFNTCRCGNVGNNGTSAYYENNRRGTSCSIRFIS